MLNKNIFLVIPTYNEKENLLRLIPQIPSEINIIVVDDNSPDKTGEIARQLKLKVIQRPKKLGLGSACITGFKKALQEGAEYIFSMDADLSHDPRDIPRFLSTSADLIIGSRYLQPKSIRNWNFIRQTISRCGTLYAKTILNVPFSDLTSGFKCYRRKVLENIDLDHFASDGYSFQIETVYKTFQKGFRIKEIPIVFVERSQGKSKFGPGIFWEAIWKTWAMRFDR